jgi:hypothetical protein
MTLNAEEQQATDELLALIESGDPSDPDTILLKEAVYGKKRKAALDSVQESKRLTNREVVKMLADAIVELPPSQREEARRKGLELASEIYANDACTIREHHEKQTSHNANKSWDDDYTKRNRIFKEFRNGVLVKTWRE